MLQCRYTTNLDIKCDLGILYERCKLYNKPFHITKSARGSKAYYDIGGLTHIDLYLVYGKLLVQSTICENKYRTLKIDDVAKSLLGIGKYNNISGKDFTKLSIKDKEAYSLRDSELVMGLSKYENYQILDAMRAIADITKLPFPYV